MRSLDLNFYLVVAFVLLVVKIFAFVNSLMHSNEEYEAAGKLTKTAWSLILSSSTKHAQRAQRRRNPAMAGRTSARYTNAAMVNTMLSSPSGPPSSSCTTTPSPRMSDQAVFVSLPAASYS